MAESNERPALAPGMSAEEFARWYWLKRELQGFARELGVSGSGGKEELASRIARRLAGEPEPAAPARPRQHGGSGLVGPLTGQMIAPEGQRLTAELRSFMVERCGPGFRFDRHMRAFFAKGGTLDE
ncbi:MAG: DUF6434 domain-containing protein, partial [Thermomicrobiales bacterium]